MKNELSAVSKRTPKETEQLLEFCRMVGNWYVNNQSTAEKPWSGISGSADQGRFIYSYEPVTGVTKGNSVWGQGVAIMALMPLAERLSFYGDPFKKAALDAAGYLCSLQILDQRDPVLFGAVRQSNPQTPQINPRDSATACMGLCTLARLTGEDEYLYRARLIGDWYLRSTMNEERWPAYTYFLDRREGQWREPGIWQVGAALAFYYLHRLTGDDRYVEEGIRPLMDGYKRLYAESVKPGTSTECIELGGQDDFAAIAALGAYLLYDDTELLEIVRHRCQALVDSQDADGSCPGYATEFVAGLTWHNFIELVETRKLKDDVTPFQKAIAKVVAFAPTIQERTLRDIRAYGGIYGQCSFGVSKSQIHQRSAGYSMMFMLRCDGRVAVPGYNVFGWE